ncbi:MAG: FAD-binding oxidoreductase, partial [Nitrospinota bacterium]
MQKSAEAIVIGGGVIGTSIFYHLARQGMRDVVLLERDIPGAGSSGKSAALVRQHYSNEVTIRLAQKSLEIFQHFPDWVGGSAGFRQTGWLQISPPALQRATEEVVALQHALGVRSELLSPEAVQELFPALNTAEVAVGAYEPEGGYADPHSVLSSFVNRARELGGKVYMGTPVRQVLVEKERVKGVVTDKGTIEAPIVVGAVGPWAQEVGKMIGVEFPLQVLRSQVAIFQPKQPEENPPLVVVDPLHDTYFRPETGNITLIGGTEGIAPEKRRIDDPNSYNEKADPEYVQGISEKLCRRLPSFENAGFVRGWAGPITVTPDWHPILGPLPGLEGFYCAVGFSGHGFKLSPAIGLAMAELITQGKATTVDLTPFRFTRFAEGD